MTMTVHLHGHLATASGFGFQRGSQLVAKRQGPVVGSAAAAKYSAPPLS
jgi:hypothetical protein